jgi:nucleoside 2-deoxyribosyltransferase
VNIYLAGPFGFSEAGRSFHTTMLVPHLQGLGHEVLDPWQLTDRMKIEAVRSMNYGRERRDAWRLLNREIAANNRKAIDRCELVFAVLDGVDVDSGTASEIGYAFARGKAIIGYRGDYRLCSDNEGTLVNLQVEYFIRESGGEIISRLDDLDDALARFLHSQ